MGILIDQGWVTARPKAGTRLAQWPPHECRIAVVIPGPGHSGDYSSWRYTRRFEAVRVAVERFNQAGGRFRIELFHNVEGDYGAGPGWKRLARDIEDGALYGVIWGFPPHRIKEEPLLTAPPVPMVFHAIEFCHPETRTAAVVYRDNFWEVMAKWLLRNGFDRVAVVGSDTHDAKAFRATLEAMGLRIPSGWLLGCNPHQPSWLGETVRGLFDRPARECPRAVMVTDDHLLEQTASELEACGATTRLVGLWNYPVPCHSRYPVWICRVDSCRWLGAAVEQLVELRTCGTVRERQRAVPPDEQLLLLNRDGKIPGGIVSAGMGG